MWMRPNLQDETGDVTASLFLGAWFKTIRGHCDGDYGTSA